MKVVKQQSYLPITAARLRASDPVIRGKHKGFEPKSDARGGTVFAFVQ